MMSDSVLALAKQNNVVLVGTDFTREYLQEYGQDAETAGRGYVRSLDRIRRAYRIGVEQAFGSDVIFDVEGRRAVKSASPFSIPMSRPVCPMAICCEC
jgi:hypothetical protein